MIKGSRITLRAWQDDDLPSLTVLRNDMKLQAQLLSRTRGSSTEQVRQWLSCNNERIILIVIENSKFDVLGFVQVSNIEIIDCHGELGICLTENVRGKGLGKEVLIIFMNYLRDIWGLRKFVVRVREDNIVAKRCYESIGFEVCGRMKKHFFIESCWYDVIVMEYLLK